MPVFLARRVRLDNLKVMGKTGEHLRCRLVQGNLASARADCATLALGVDAHRGLACVTALSLRRGNLSSAAETGERWLAQAAVDDPLRNHVLTMRGETASRDRSAGADVWFQQALRSQTGDVRVLAAFSRQGA